MYLFCASALPVSAQVVINEISPGTSPEWVELYKTSEGELGLANCFLYLHNDLESSQKVDLTTELFSAEQKYKQITWSSSWLNNEGDTVILQCPWGQDQVSYGSDVDNRTYGRSPDASGNVNILEQSTPGGANSALKTSPTLTSSPTPSPLASVMSSPTPSTTPTPIITKKPTPVPTVKPSPTLFSSPSSTPMVLGVATSTPTIVDSNTGSVSPGKTIPNLAILMIALGLAFVGIAGFSIWKKYHETKFE